MDVNRWIISGWRGSGKTTFCQALISQARAAGWETAGIVSPGVFEHDSRVAIDAVDIRTGQVQRLAALKQQTPDDLPFGDWFFNRQTLDWGNRVLANSLPCDLLVIDELGPLEFNLASGWHQALDLLCGEGFRLAVVVIRPELLARAQVMFGPSQTIFINTPEQAQTRLRQANDELRRLKPQL